MVSEQTGVFKGNRATPRPYAARFGRLSPSIFMDYSIGITLDIAQQHLVICGRSIMATTSMSLPPKTFTALDAMMENVERTTAATLNATQAVSNAVKQAIREEADPHILAGALVEGIAMTVLAGIPEDSRRGVANDLLVLLYTRLDSLNMFDGMERQTR